MKPMLFAATLLAASMALAQQGQPPPAGPPHTTPPTFPDEHAPPHQLPPDQEAPPQASSATVQEQIQQGLNSEPALSNSSVGVHVNEGSVILTGTVSTEKQHGLALRIAQSHAGDRKVVDKITLTQQT